MPAGVGLFLSYTPARAGGLQPCVIEPEPVRAGYSFVNTPAEEGVDEYGVSYLA